VNDFCFINIQASLHYSQKSTFFSVTQQPTSGLGGLIARLCGAHTHTHTHTHTLFRIPRNEWSARRWAPAYTTHNKHNRRKPMPLAGFKLIIPTIKQLQTSALDRTNTGFAYKSQPVHRILIQLINKHRFTTYFHNIHLYLDRANCLFLWATRLKCSVTFHISSHRLSPLFIDLKIGCVFCKVTLRHKMSKFAHLWFCKVTLSHKMSKFAHP